MEEMFIKPGNQERGWNDPPQFSYGLQTTSGTRKSLLTKRVAPPQVAGPGAMSPSSSSPLAPPPCGLTPPPPIQARTLCPMMTAPPPCMGTSPPLREPIMCQRGPGSSQSVREPDVEVVVTVLEWALSACQRAVPGQVCDDISKRLRLLEVNWRSGRLSLPVRRRMETLAQELQASRWDVADEIHRSLMVDHVTEVSQWMVGVKRLIAETRNLDPDLLKPDQSQVEPGQDLVEPGQNPIHSVSQS
ncbi:steroid receptor RNA activator 1 [Polymixia lowei]